MIEFLLRELEKTAHPIFSKNELTSISSEQFEELVSKRVLIFYRPKDTDLERIRQPKCPHGCYLTVIEHDGELEGFCDEHPEEGSVPVDKDDLLRYTLSTENLLNLIAQVNELSGSLQTIEGGFFYMGHKYVKGKQVGFVFNRSIDSDRFIELSGLRGLFQSNDFLVIPTPITRAEDIQLESRLQQEKILLTTLWDVIDRQNFSLCSDEALEIIDAAANIPAPTRIFQLMDGLTWEEVTLALVSKDSIRISARDKSERLTFSEIGFKDKRRGDLPDTKWEILSFIAETGRLTSQNAMELKVGKSLRTYMTELRKHLKSLLGINSDPFHSYKERKAYAPKFTIRDESYGKDPH